MKMFIILFFRIWVTIFAQYPCKSDTDKIYEKILSIYNKKVLLEKNTSIETIKRFDFKKPSSHELRVDKILSSNWQSFLNSVDTSNFRPGILDASIRKQQTQHGNTNLKRLTLSPVILSDDKLKAVCAISVYGSPEDSGEQVYLLEKKGEKWIIIKYYMLSIS